MSGLDLAAVLAVAVVALSACTLARSVTAWALARYLPSRPEPVREPARRGETLGFAHIDLPVWIVQGLPVAVSQSGSTTLVWGEASQRWRIVGPEHPVWAEAQEVAKGAAGIKWLDKPPEDLLTDRTVRVHASTAKMFNMVQSAECYFPFPTSLQPSDRHEWNTRYGVWVERPVTA